MGLDDPYFLALLALSMVCAVVLCLSLSGRAVSVVCVCVPVCHLFKFYVNCLRDLAVGGRDVGEGARWGSGVQWNRVHGTGHPVPVE